MTLPLVETVALILFDLVQLNILWCIPRAPGVRKSRFESLHYVTLVKSLNLSGPHLWNRNPRGMLRIKWTDCRSNTTHLLGSHYMMTSRQMEAVIPGPLENPRSLESEHWSWKRCQCPWPGIFILNGPPKVENSATRQQGWVCDLMSGAWLGLRVTSTSFCCLEGSGDAKRWGQGNSRHDPGRDGGLPGAVTGMWGILLAAGEGLCQPFFFFLRF